MIQHYDLKWLTEKYDRGEALSFLYFWGHSNKANEQVGKFCLSQWYESPFTVNGITYKTSEHWMMAHKALLFDNKDIAEQIIACQKPAEAKALGRKVLNYDDHVWNKHKFEIVKQGNIHKFSQNSAMAAYLLQTGDKIIVEASPTDIIWGIGLTQDSKDINNIHAWRGENLLGFVLMETRDYLKASRP